MRKIIFILALLSANTWAAQGFIVKNAVVDKVTSSSGNEDTYRVYYSSGTNDKCNGHVRFGLVNAGSEMVFNRAFTLATTAIAAGMRINIFSYSDNEDCDSAVTIELSR